MSVVTYDDLIKRCNEFLYGYLYSGGTLFYGSAQHRDLVRTFFAGAMEPLVLSENKENVAALLKDYEAMTRLDWWPDRRFAPPPSYLDRQNRMN